MINLLPLQHSPVGGSGMGRWSQAACPGSVNAARHYPNLSSYEAEEGTAAHELAETCLKLCLNAVDYLGQKFNDISVNDEMAQGVQSYIDFVRGIIAANPGCEFHVEFQFHLHELHDLMFSTIDVIIVNREQRWAHVIDFKYGRVPVPATSPQLKYYATVLGSDRLHPRGWLDLDHILLSIHQPRLWGRSSDVDTITTTPLDMAEWVQVELIPSINLALSDDAPRRPGDWCRYCPAKMGCPELQGALQYMKPPFPVNNDQLAWLISMKGVFKEMVNDAEVEAAERLMKGENIPGFKPVRSYGKSAIVDPSRCAGELLAVGMTHAEVFVNKLRGITELKKNKAAWPIIEKYKQRGDKGIKAVSLSAPQPAVAIPTRCFSN